MKYTVVWTSDAERDLAALWVDAGNRKLITSAADIIDGLLREEAQAKGESRAGRLRFLYVSPLAVNFEVREDDRLVRVLAIRLVSAR
jgi:plasmid stabilization system protein ParE